MVDLPREPRAQLMIRTGTLSLRRICDYFHFDYNPFPNPDDPIAIDRADFDQVYDDFVGKGMPVVADRELAWRGFAGWRVNYDRPLLTLASWVEAPSAPWSSDRQLSVKRRAILRRFDRPI